jgi:hypothetical protein
MLGRRFAHILGLIHGHLMTNNIVFDLNHCIQITDFVSCLSGNGPSDFSREGWNPEMDIPGFVSILFEIVVGRPATDEAEIPAAHERYADQTNCRPLMCFNCLSIFIQNKRGETFSCDLNPFSICPITAARTASSTSACLASP